jgi:hypothetical protein
MPRIQLEMRPSQIFQCHGGRQCLEAEWRGLKLGRATAVPEGAPEGGTRELASDGPLFTGQPGQTWRRKMPWHGPPVGTSEKGARAGERWSLTFRARRCPMRRGTLCTYSSACQAKCHGTGRRWARAKKAPASGGHSPSVHADARCAGALPAVSLLPATQDAMAPGRRWARANKAPASGGHSLAVLAFWSLPPRLFRCNALRTRIFILQVLFCCEVSLPLFRCSALRIFILHVLFRIDVPHRIHPHDALRHTLQSSCRGLAHDDWNSSLSLRATLPVCSLWPSASASTLPPSCRG